MTLPGEVAAAHSGTVLVTGVGGGAGQAILKALQGTGYRVIAADGEVLGTGLYAAARGYVIPYAGAPGFIQRLLEICAREKAGLLLPGLDAELPILSENRARFQSIGTTVMVSSPDVVAICDDKLATAGFLKAKGFPFPQTWRLRDFPAGPLPFPLVLKPQLGGARSKGVRLIRVPSELATARAELAAEEYVAQEFIEGPEYTCGTLTLPDGLAGTIVLRRTLRDGDTYKAFVERHPALEQFVATVAQRLAPFGSCNLQLRVRDGTPYIFEMNARSSGTTYCRALAGFNEPKAMADALLQNEAPTLAARPLTVLRYWKELAVENDDVRACAELREVSVGASL